MSSERTMRKVVVRALRALDAVPVENGVGIGTPDVNYVGGWIELKSVEAWPARPETPLRMEHFTREQAMWLARRNGLGGRAFLLLKAGRDWLLFRGWQAYKIVHPGAPREALLKFACWASIGSFDGESLCRFLRDDARGRSILRGEADAPAAQDAAPHP